jgi:uncharacterized repeat protein (TIGR01451 family)
VASPGASTAGTNVTNSAAETTTTTTIGTPTTATATTAIGSTTTGPTLTITKSANATGTVGQNLTYTIVIGNTGAAAATGTTFTDTLPTGLTFVSATDSLGGTVTNTGGTLSENIGSLAAGSADTITVVATPGSSLAGQSITNTASASATNFNGGTAVTASATTTFSGTTPTGHICFLAGVPGDGTPQSFVQNLYRELLGREPDSDGDTFWVDYVTAHNNSAGHMQAAQGFMNSAEYKEHYITCVYENFLGRAPDAGGLQFWTQKMGNPGTPGQNTGSADERYIVAAFLGSDEFYIKSGNTPQSWINAVYEDVFGRAADGQGAAFWMNELQTRGAADRDGIMRDLLMQPEAAHLLLNSFYPAAGGTSSNPLAAPGTEAGTGSTPLAQLTGGGWENLYLEGPYGNNAEANDGFFASLSSGGNWIDVQLLILDTDQFYTNPNRPVTA